MLLRDFQFWQNLANLQLSLNLGKTKSNETNMADWQMIAPPYSPPLVIYICAWTNLRTTEIRTQLLRKDKRVYFVQS